MKVKSFSCVRLLATPWTAAYEAPPSMGFSRQKYWSGVPLPSPSLLVKDPPFHGGSIPGWGTEISYAEEKQSSHVTTRETCALQPRACTPQQRPAAAKSLQSCPTLCNPIDGSPPASPVPGILQARTLEWVAISFSNAWKWKVKVKSLSRARLLATPGTGTYQAGIFQARVLEWGAIAFSAQRKKKTLWF